MIKSPTLAERREATQYAMVGGVRYKQGFTTPLLRCVSLEQSRNIMKEVHEGVCGSHIGGASLAAKELRVGFYWPTLRSDCIAFVRACDKCQRFSNIPRASPEELTSILAPYPFALWGVDMVGPFPEAKGQLKHLVVPVDYFTKWIEAEAIASITAERIKMFYWKRLICRFGVPMAIVSDNGSQCIAKPTKKFCKNRGIQMRFPSVEPPQTKAKPSRRTKYS